MESVIVGKVTLDELLNKLEEGPSDFYFVSLVRLFAAYQRQDAASIDNLRIIPFDNPLMEKLQRFIGLHIKIAQKQEKPTTEEMIELFAIFGSAEFKRVFSGQREQVNRLLVSLQFESQGRSRPDRLCKAVEEQAKTDHDGFWDEARILAQFIKASRTPDRLLAECKNLIGMCGDIRNVAEKPLVAELLLNAELAEVAKFLEVLNFAEAYKPLKHIISKESTNELSKRVATALDHFLSTDSLEAAQLAQKSGDSGRARAIWKKLSAKGSSEAAHELAVDLFKQGYGEVIANDSQANRSLADALPYWKIVYDSESYWQHLSEKCLALHTSNKPFNPETLEQTRQSLPEDAVGVLAQLAVRYARTNQKHKAQESVRAILDNPFGRDVGRNVLDRQFAPPLLDNSVLNATDAMRFERALKSAELVLDCDPENLKGLILTLEAAYSQSEDARVGKINSTEEAIKLFSRSKERLQKFSEKKLMDNTELVPKCKIFWLEYGRMLELAVMQAYDKLTSAGDNQKVRFKLIELMREHVDDGLKHILPACERWSIQYGNWQFKDLDSKIPTKSELSRNQFN